MATSLYDEEEIKTGVAAGDAQNLMKASLFNLIVLCQDPARVIHCERLISTITEKFPCRIIFVRADPSAQSDYIRTKLTLQTIGVGTNRVLCDLITIEASPMQFPKIPFIILPQIQPDLPIYILLGHDPAQDLAVLSQIQKYASRIVFDPTHIDHFSNFSQRVISYMQSITSDVIDMNWARTKAWREILARAFNTSETLSQLAQSKMIQITYVSSPNRNANQPTMREETQAVYLQAWIASKLNWTLLAVEREDRCLRISYKYDHASLTVSLVPKDTEILPSGSIFSFEAMTHGDYHFLISHENNSKLVRAHASNPERCEMPYTLFLNNYQNGPALVNEIFYQLPSEHYLAMLQMLNSPMWATT